MLNCCVYILPQSQLGYHQIVGATMSDYRWVCKECGKHFNPLNKDGSFSFNCPRCISRLTVPVTSGNGKEDATSQ